MGWQDMSVYVRPSERVSFNELSERAVLRDEVAIGFRRNGRIVSFTMVLLKEWMDSETHCAVL